MKLKTLYTKGRKRIKKILGRIVPYNTRFRPGGVCRINLDEPESVNPREVKVHSIYPKAVTKLHISEELYRACSEYWKPKREVVTDYMVVEVPNGRIYTDNESSVAIITQYDRVVENVSLNLTEGKVTAPNLNSIFEQRYFTRPEHIEGTVFSLLSGGAGLNNIGHWFLDVLPRLHLLKESGLYDKVDWFFVPSTRYSYQTETLELLGIPSEKIISSDTYTHITADCIVASTAPRGNDTLVPQWLCDYIRNSFLPFAEEDSGDNLPIIGSQNIYISRSDSTIRNVLNEKELQKKLEPFAFQTIVSSGLSIREKIRLFSRAKVVLSPTGAGLISMLFCPPGTKLIEIFNEGFVIEPFFDIATKIDLDYEYIICKGNGNVKNATQGMYEHLYVETDRVVKILKRLEKSIEKEDGERVEVA